MWLCYVDECGNTGLKLDDPNQPFHTMAAVLVPEERVLPLAAAVRELVIAATGERPAVELHGVQLYGGHGPWADLDHEVRNKLYRDVVGLLTTLGCEIAYARIVKSQLPLWFTSRTANPHMLALQFLVERIDTYLSTQTDPLRQRGLIVADETEQHGPDAIAMVDGMQTWGPPVGWYRNVERVIDTVHFVRSADNVGVQLADLVAYAINRIATAPRPPTKPGDLFMAELFELAIAPRIRKYKVWPDPPLTPT